MGLRGVHPAGQASPATRLPQPHVAGLLAFVGHLRPVNGRPEVGAWRGLILMLLLIFLALFT